MARSINIVAVLLLAACTPVDLDELRFACKTSADCAGDKICDPRAQICVLPNQLSDGGYSDATISDSGTDAGVLADSGISDAAISGGCFPPPEATTPATRYWWCWSRTPAELDEFLETNYARILDLTIERSQPSFLYAAALARRDLGLDFRWSQEESYSGLRAICREGYRLLDANAFNRSGETRYAGLFQQQRRDQQPYLATRYQREGLDDISAEINAELSPGQRAEFIDLDRYPDTSGERYSLLGYARHPTRASTVAPSLSVAELEELMEDNYLLDFESTETTDRFGVIYQARPRGSLPQSIVLSGTSTQLHDAVRDGVHHVQRIVATDVGGFYRYAALLSRTATSPEQKIISRLSEADGTPSLFLAEVGGSTLASVHSELPVRGGYAIAPLIAAYTLKQLEERQISSNTSIPYYPAPNNNRGCPTGQLGRPLTADTLLTYLGREYTSALKSLITYFGERAIEDFARQLGLNSLHLAGDVGCDDDAMQMSVRDLAVLYRRVFELDRFGSIVRDGLVARLMPAISDGHELLEVLPVIIHEEARRNGVSGAVELAYRERAVVRYMRGARDDGSAHRLHSGFFQAPDCTRGERIFVYGIALSSAPSNADSDYALYAVRAELLREVIAETLVAFQACAP